MHWIFKINLEWISKPPHLPPLTIPSSNLSTKVFTSPNMNDQQPMKTHNISWFGGPSLLLPILLLVGIFPLLRRLSVYQLAITFVFFSQFAEMYMARDPMIIINSHLQTNRYSNLPKFLLKVNEYLRRLLVARPTSLHGTVISSMDGVSQPMVQQVILLKILKQNKFQEKYHF